MTLLNTLPRAEIPDALKRRTMTDASKLLRPEVIDPSTDPGWDERVASHPGGSFFHSAAWARVLSESYGHTPMYFAARNGAELLGLLPVLEIRSVLTGCRGVSLPFTDWSPPLVPDGAAFSDWLQYVIAHGRSRKWKYFECRGGSESLDGVASSASFLGHVLDLSVGEERLFKSFEGRVRNAVRKAESLGVKVEIAQTPEAVRDYYHLHCETRQKHGVPPQPFHFFQAIYREILSKGNGIVALARHNGLPIAAAVFFHLGRKVIYKYSASNKASQQFRPNNLLMWEAIRWYARAGHVEMHFGRTSLNNEGLRMYKRGFGTREERIDYLRYDYRQEKFVSGSEAPPGMVNRICGTMPIWALRVAGHLLYRHVS